MRAMMGSTVFPRRLTQLFADTKKSYENVVQTQRNAPEAASLHLKLRIQKDRLVAWGFQWSDRSTAAQAGDIDGSLDRAGISDLVASIMCSIRELLDEAEGLQPTSDLDLPESLGELKMFSKSVQEPSWTTGNLKRLEEILKDLTTSIDTLCDLSTTKVMELSPSEHMEGSTVERKRNNPYPLQKLFLSKSATSPTVASAALAPQSSSNQMMPTPRADDLIRLSQIAAERLRFRQLTDNPGSAPPSYESVATGSEDRASAYLSSLRRSSSTSKSSPNIHEELPVLLDYGERFTGRAFSNLKPDPERFEELSSVLNQILQQPADPYRGLLRLEGWTVDLNNSQCAYVYEVPSMHRNLRASAQELQPRSLLSFLQNGGDTDSNNIPSLENRFRLALNIASSVMLLQQRGVTHRNINSGNVIFFVDGDVLSSNEKVWKGSVIRLPYLTAFHQRSSNDQTRLHDPVFPGIYQHPSLGEGHRDRYGFAHDLYSLGLILLEIGLWMPIGKFWKTKYTIRDFKARLQDIYLRKLSGKCGDGYMNAVLHCMTAADSMFSGNSETGQAPPMDNTCPDIVSSVINPLERCCLIDSNKSGGVPPSLSAGQLLGVNGSDAVGSAPDQQAELQATDLTNEITQSFAVAVDSSNGRSALVQPKQNHSAAESRKIVVWSHELPGLYLKYWNSTMFPKLERILSRAISRWESYTVDLFMAGADADSARPTVYMECTSTGKVRKILRHLNKELRLFEIKVVSGQIVRSKAGKRKNRKTTQKKKKRGLTSGPDSRDHTADQCSLNPHYQPKPVCGASIGAFLNGIHLPPVSFGGAVLVDGEPYGMSVHHMLEDDDEIELGLEDAMRLLRSIAPRPGSLHGHGTANKVPSNLPDQYQGLYPFEVLEPAEAPDDSSIGYALSEYSSSPEMSTGSLPQAIYPYQISEDESDEEWRVSNGDEFWLSPDYDRELTRQIEEKDEDGDLGDTTGVQVGCGEELIVTQPALDDVDKRFFPCEEDADDDHTSSHKLGHIHASSGIRRARRKDIIHEIDWALIKINEHRIQARNIVQGGGRHSKASATLTSTANASSYPDSYPCKVMKASDLGGLHVHASGRTSGLQTGTILPAISMVSMPGRSFASHSWQVRGNFGEGGDSGAWVLDNATGHVCGHVLAYSSASGLAYIAPMEVLLEDMAVTLQATVTLPDAPVVSPPLYNQSEHSLESLQPSRSLSPPLPTSPPALLHELSSLSLNEMDKSSKGINAVRDTRRAFTDKRAMVGDKDQFFGETSMNDGSSRVQATG